MKTMYYLSIILMSITGIVVCCFTGCSEAKKTDSIKCGNYENVGYLTKVNFEGHTYLVRSDASGYQGYGGICHDENCKCKEGINE